MPEKVAGVAHASRSGARGGEEEGGDVETGKRWLPRILGTAGPSGFGYEFRALESAFLSGSSNSDEKSLAYS